MSEQEPPSPQPDVVEALANIQDDDSQKRDAFIWAIDRMRDGTTAEQLIEILTEEGWDAESVEDIVESARKETRRERGVITRDEVVRDLNVDYRRATSGLQVAFRGGLFGLFGFLRGFMASMRAARRLKLIARDKKSES